MLLSQKTLDAVVKAEIDRFYRRWNRPAVVKERCSGRRTVCLRWSAWGSWRDSEIEPTAAGYGTTEEVLADIRPPDPGRHLYEVRVRWAGEDPRLALRESTNLDEAALEAINSVVSGIGRHGGPTGIELLRAIAANPATLAQDLADAIGIERDVLKRRTRQLKEIGLPKACAWVAGCRREERPTWPGGPRGHRKRGTSDFSGE